MKDHDQRFLEEIEAMVSGYSPRRGAALPLLHRFQEARGYLSSEDIWVAAELLEMKVSELKELVTFFTMFRNRPLGRHVIEVCTNLSCQLAAGKNPLQDWETELGIEEGETTEDGSITLLAVECLGACGGGPAVLVDGELLENVGPEQRARLVERLRG